MECDPQGNKTVIAVSIRIQETCSSHDDLVTCPNWSYTWFSAVAVSEWPYITLRQPNTVFIQILTSSPFLNTYKKTTEPNGEVMSVPLSAYLGSETAEKDFEVGGPACGQH
jgi:hypothetical protein